MLHASTISRPALGVSHGYCHNPYGKRHLPLLHAKIPRLATSGCLSAMDSQSKSLCVNTARRKITRNSPVPASRIRCQESIANRYSSVAHAGRYIELQHPHSIVDINISTSLPLEIDMEPAKKEKRGFVYFIYAPELNKLGPSLIKIGKAAIVQRRIQQLQTGNPFPLQIHCTIETNFPVKLESFLHRHYKKSRYRNEWFQINIADLDIDAQLSEYIRHYANENDHRVGEIIQIEDEQPHDADMFLICRNGDGKKIKHLIAKWQTADTPEIIVETPSLWKRCWVAVRQKIFKN